jgi:hypothetical protein
LFQNKKIASIPIIDSNPTTVNHNTEISMPSGPKVSALSLSSVYAKKALENSKSIVKQAVDLPETFQKRTC